MVYLSTSRFSQKIEALTMNLSWMVNVKRRMASIRSNASSESPTLIDDERARGPVSTTVQHYAHHSHTIGKRELTRRASARRDDEREDPSTWRVSRRPFPVRPVFAGGRRSTHVCPVPGGWKKRTGERRKNQARSISVDPSEARCRLLGRRGRPALVHRGEASAPAPLRKVENRRRRGGTHSSTQDSGSGP